MKTLDIAKAVLCFLLASGSFATGAYAEGPFYSKCGKKEGLKCLEYKRLAKGETAALAIVGGTFTLGADQRVFTCSSVKGSSSRLVGSATGTAGSSEQTLEFEGCGVKGNGEPCSIPHGRIVTNPTIGTLSKENKASVKGEKLFASFRPASGFTFATIEFEGSGCFVAKSSIELGGTAKLGAAGVVDLERSCTAAEEKEVGAELCKEGHAPLKLLVNEELGKKGLVFFPGTLIKTVFVEEGKVVSEVKEKLTTFTLPVTKFTGHANMELPGVEDWGVFGM